MDSKDIIQAFKNDGFKVEVRHLHEGNSTEGERGYQLPFPPFHKERKASLFVTSFTASHVEKRIMFVGQAQCCYKDVPVKKVGLAKAAGRCYASYNRYLNNLEINKLIGDD